MKLRALLGFALLTFISLTFSLPTVGQTLTPPYKQNGLTVHWQIVLRGVSADTWALATYDVTTVAPAPPRSPKEHIFSKFSVEAYAPQLPDETKLGVFLGPSTSIKEPYGKLVGIIEVQGGSGAMILVGAKTPMIKKGTTVAVTLLSPIPGQNATLNGKF